MLPDLEKRHYPRVNANIDAEVDCAGGFKIRGIVLDTSSTGLRLQCNAIERELLTPRGEWTRHGKPIEVKVTLVVPRPNNDTRTIEVHCAVAFSRRVARDCYHVGMRYKNLDQESFLVLGEFIDRRLKRA
ncbi:MAG: PilZ domain-containing protein [Methylococcaceae bacterium]|nr:PilZ domain-containing protein [Methylococcaceae bacterium]MCI0732291.1 PilZ domain-containing protein [Methylococcaceae bacterium]